MDVRIFFMLAFYWVVGDTLVHPIYHCNDNFLSSIGKGSITSEFITTAAASCEILQSHSWYNAIIFIGLNNTQMCPAMNHCSNLTPPWMMGTLPLSNAPVSRQICETGATGCCENNTLITVRNCSPFHFYFHRNSTGCDKAYCYVNGPDVNPILGKRASGGHTDNKQLLYMHAKRIM